MAHLMAKFKIQHVTKYIYEVPVRDSANQIMLYPISDNFQEIEMQSVFITGNPMVEIHIDSFENKVGTFTHSQPHSELIIHSRIEVVTKSKKLPEDTVPVEEQWQLLEAMRLQIPYINFLRLESFQALSEIQQIIDEGRCKNCSPLTCAKDFSTYVYDHFTYQKGLTTVETTLDEIWKIKSGVCQDFAHILLALLRLVKIPARYVSGYICPNKEGMRGEGATHAWVEAYIPFYGWLGLDPTNNCIANESHVRLAVGKNFSDCSPVRGTYRGTSNHTLEVAVSVSYEDGQTSTELPEISPTTTSSTSKNSYRRHQEMQMQQ
jgi:transglutaminase-like putative cysteine protease